MKTIEIKLYKFEELNDEAKQKAVEDFRKHQWEHGEYLIFFKEYCKEKASKKGFENIELQYSLSYSEGDGLSFKCKNIDIEKFINEVIPENKQSLRDVIYNNCYYECTGNDGARYCYASKNDIDFYLDNANKEYQNIDEVCEMIRELLTNTYLDLCKELENDGYEEIERQDSDEYIKETIETNDYDFLENGKMY